MFFPSSSREFSGASALVAPPPVWWKPALALAIALVLQSALLPQFALRGAVPSLVLLVVLWYALRAGSAAGLLFGTIAGVCEDALSGWSGAGWTISTGLTGALAGSFSGSGLADSRVWLMLLAALASLVRYALFAIVLQAEHRSLPLPTAHFHLALWQALLSALLGYFAVTFVPRFGVSRVFFG